MATDNEYILFLDETDTNESNQYFCLAGFIISRQEYENILIPQINELKMNILNLPHVVFHYKDMRQQDKDFKILDNSKLRDNFWRKLCNILKNINITTLAAYIDGVSYRKNYSKNIALSEYNVLFNEIINSFVNFLLKNNGDGTIIVESRNLTQNRSTQKLYTTMTQTGTNIYLQTTIKRKISTLNFNIKKDNCIGLQIADMIPLVLVRRIHGKSNPYTLYNIFSSKLYKNNQSSVDGYGFIKVLR